MFGFLRRIWDLAQPYRGRLILGILTGIIGGLIEPLMIATTVFVFSLIFPTENAGTSALSERLAHAPAFLQRLGAAAEQSLSGKVDAKNPWAVAGIVALIPVVMILRGIFQYLNVYLLQWTAVRTVVDLRVRLFNHIMNLSAGFFSRRSTGELMSRINSDTGALQNILGNSVNTLVKDPVTVIGMLGFLIWQQPRLTLISMAVLPICMVPILIYNRKIRRASRAMQSHVAELSGVMSESLSGNRVVKAYNLEKIVVDQFRETARRFIGHYMRIVRSTEIPGPLLESVGAVGIAAVLVYLAVRPGPRPESAAFLGVVLAVFAMYRPLKNLARLHNNLEQARAASERVFEFLATVNEVTEPASPKPLRAAGAPVHFDNLDFGYGDKMVLHQIQLTVQPGTLVALVGPSGSGKTSLTSLLLRLYDPQKGAIRIGGIDIRDVATQDLRSQIAVVTQETVLFNQSIYRNIELGRPGASREEIIQAARHANAYEFIMERPNGFESVIGEKGQTLSGGQRQRIAIARAILRNAPILILDEATSSLDSESERAVQAALEKLMVGRTTICIAHRLSTIQQANLIVVLDRGRIVETGTHAELLQKQGVYARLHDLQFET